MNFNIIEDSQWIKRVGVSRLYLLLSFSGCILLKLFTSLFYILF